MRLRYKQLSLQQIRTFHEVCRHHSYSEVARRLGLSTSAVWEQVRGLERYVGATLIETRDGVVQPTSDGERLRDLVLPVLAGLESARATFDQQRGRPPEAITLVSGLRMLMEEIAVAVPLFQERYPGVRLRLLYAEDRRIERLIEHGDVDLALMLEPGPAIPTAPTIVHEPAYELDYLLVTPRNHPLFASRSLRLQQIAQYPLVVGAPDTSTRRRIDEVLHRHNLTKKITIAVETNSAAMTFAAVRSGSGIGITAGPLSAFLSRGLGVRSLKRWFGAARYVFVWMRGASVPPAQRELADLIRACATDR